MVLALMGTLDLSIITDQLKRKLDDCCDHSPLWGQQDLDGNPVTKFTIQVTGSSPLSVRGDGDTQLSIYLFHVGQDRFQLNASVNPPSQPTVQPISAQPLALNLYYLLTAYSDKDYVHEQRAMSIAMRCFHETPIVRGTIPIGAGSAVEEYTLTMEPQTWGDLSTLWQGISAPSRLSAVYRASVVFITPDAPLREPKPKPQRLTIDSAPAEPVPVSLGGQLIGTLTTVSFFAPDSTVALPRAYTVDYAPGVAAAGGRLELHGGNLDKPTAARTFIVGPSGSVADISAWVDPVATRSTDQRRLVLLPSTQGAPPGGTPPPGIYQLRVGDSSGPRSNSTPFSIAAEVTPATNPPLLTPVAGIYLLSGSGFIPGATELLIGSVALQSAGGAPGPGQFALVPAGIAFVPPSSLKGFFPVRVRVRSAGPPPVEVESTPSWAVSL